MNIFICNRYDSKKENIFILSPKSPLNKYNAKLLKYPFLKNLLLEDINNTNKNENSNNGTNNFENNDNPEDFQVIDYPYSTSQSNINLGNKFANKFIKNDSSIYDDNSCYNCFNWENVEEKNKVRLNRNENNIKRKKQINFGKNFNKTGININNDDKFKLNDSEIDVEDTIKGEDNINISKLKFINKNKEVKKKAFNINIIPKVSKKNKIKDLNKIPLNNKNKSNLKNNLAHNNNTYIKKNYKINKLYKSKSKNNTANNTMKSNSKMNITCKINKRDYLNTTGKIDKNKSKQNIKQEININNNKKKNRILNKNFSDDNFYMSMNNYSYKEISNKNNINNIKKNKENIRSLKKKIQKNFVNENNN